MSKWISVKDRLPKETEEVLIYGIYDEVAVGQYFDGAFQDESGAMYHGVTHWMPLPEPPEE